MTITWRHAIILLAIIGGMLAFFGVSLAMAEWRAKDPNLEPIQAEMRDIRRDLDELRDQPGGVDVSVDIEQLYARVNYLDCVGDAEAPLGDAEAEADEAFANYLTDNSTYAVYESAYDAYSVAYDQYSAAVDTCWQTYLSEAPLG